MTPAVSADQATLETRLLQRAARVAWLPAVLACGALVGLDAVIRYRGVSRLTAELPAGWTAVTIEDALSRLGLTPSEYAAFGLTLTVISALLFGSAGWLIVRYGWAEPMARFTAYFVVLFGTSWLIDPERLPAGLRTVATTLEDVGWTGFLLFFFLFPSGRFVPPWLRWPVTMLLGIGLVVQFAVPDSGGSLSVIAWVALLLLPAVAAQVWRYRAVSGAAQRRQTRWLVFGFSATVGAVVVLIVLEALVNPRPPASSALIFELVGQTLGTLLFLPIPLAVVIGLTRHGLWDVDVAVSRTLVYGALSGLIAIVYAVAIGAGLVVSGSRGLAVSILVGLLVAALFNPVRSALQRGVNRLLYGDRDEPYSLLTTIGRELEGAADGGALLQSIVETMTQRLRLPYAAIRTGGARVIAEAGRPTESTVQLALVHHRTPVGELTVGLRPGETDLSHADRRTLEELARPIAAALQAVTLSDALQRSRESLVLAREEERRRVRRELHDRIGPMLAAVRLKAGNARMLLASGDEGEATKQLRALESELGASVDSVRTLAYELRPPVLDELGLIAAIKAAAEDVGSPPAVSVIVGGPLPELPAALEVAAYWITRAALANVVHHAAARTCEIALTADRDLTITITDDGCGTSRVQPGLGLLSMRERAEELGGTLVVGARPGGGTQVTAALPFPGGGR